MNGISKILKPIICWPLWRYGNISLIRKKKIKLLQI